MASVEDTKQKGKSERQTVTAKDVGTVDAKEFTAKPEAAPLAKKPAGKGDGLAVRTQEQIAKMADAGYEAVDKFAKDVGTAGTAPAVIDHDELDNLVAVPFVVVEKTIRQGDYGPYLSLVCILPSDDVVVINAGGTQQKDGHYSGIPGQLDGIEISPEKPHRVPNGLRRSDYNYENMSKPGAGPNGGALEPAHTYYLDYSDEKGSLFARLKSKTKKPRAGQNGTAKA